MKLFRDTTWFVVVAVVVGGLVNSDPVKHNLPIKDLSQAIHTESGVVRHEVTQILKDNAKDVTGGKYQHAPVRKHPDDKPGKIAKSKDPETLMVKVGAVLGNIKVLDKRMNNVKKTKKRQRKKLKKLLGKPNLKKHGFKTVHDIYGEIDSNLKKGKGTKLSSDYIRSLLMKKKFPKTRNTKNKKKMNFLSDPSKRNLRKAIQSTRKRMGKKLRSFTWPRRRLWNRRRNRNRRLKKGKTGQKGKPKKVKKPRFRKFKPRKGLRSFRTGRKGKRPRTNRKKSKLRMKPILQNKKLVKKGMSKITLVNGGKKLDKAKKDLASLMKGRKGLKQWKKFGNNKKKRKGQWKKITNALKQLRKRKKCGPVCKRKAARINRLKKTKRLDKHVTDVSSKPVYKNT